MASDFSAAWQCLSKRTIVFFVTDQTPCPLPQIKFTLRIGHFYDKMMALNFLFISVTPDICICDKNQANFRANEVVFILTVIKFRKGQFYDKIMKSNILVHTLEETIHTQF
jgi:hypothetical protein